MIKILFICHGSRSPIFKNRVSTVLLSICKAFYQRFTNYSESRICEIFNMNSQWNVFSVS